MSIVSRVDDSGIAMGNSEFAPVLLVSSSIFNPYDVTVFTAVRYDNFGRPSARKWVAEAITVPSSSLSELGNF